MRQFVFFLSIFAFSSLTSFSQVSEMNWELDYEIYLTMANDSNYMYDVRDLFHITDLKNLDFTSEFVFYPVSPGANYSNEIRKQDSIHESNHTLWSALHIKIGGGWVHFTNCIAYALETQMLDLREPIMKRPESSWKPDPVTETWKRTHKWEFYIPVDQKLAVKEYKIRAKSDQLGDLESLPPKYIENFLSTSKSEYWNLKAEGDMKALAQLDLVKVLMGANFLGEAQISYVSNAVMNALQNYSASKLPSVLIFDEFEAAAAMTLDMDGYQLESIVFRSSAELSEEDITKRQIEIADIIKTINEYNKESFKKRLSSYYND